MIFFFSFFFFHCARECAAANLLRILAGREVNKTSTRRLSPPVSLLIFLRSRSPFGSALGWKKATTWQRVEQRDDNCRMIFSNARGANRASGAALKKIDDFGRRLINDTLFYLQLRSSRVVNVTRTPILLRTLRESMWSNVFYASNVNWRFVYFIW